MEESSQSFTKNGRPRKIRRVNQELSLKIKIGMMSSEQFAAEYPEAYALHNFFYTTRTKSGLIMPNAAAITKSKHIAIQLVSDPNTNIEELKDCIRWCFSNEKYLDTFWGHVQVNHLDTVKTVLNHFQTLKKVKEAKKQKSGDLSRLDRFNR